MIDITNKDNFLFYDCEVYPHNSFIVFKNYDKTETTIVLHNSDYISELRKLVQGKVLIGYNNHNYDDYILSLFLSGMSQGRTGDLIEDRAFTATRLKQLNDQIISGKEPFININAGLITFDVMKLISNHGFKLKRLEGDLGMSIEETPIDFNINRELTLDELSMAIEYCEHDVDATIEVFKFLEDREFKPKCYLYSLYTEKLGPKAFRNAYRWSNRSMVDQILANPYYTKWDTIRLDGELGLNNKEYLSKVPKDIAKLWKTDNPYLVTGLQTEYPEQKLFENVVSFSNGGFHSVHEYKHKFDNIHCLDVTSLYPNLMVNNNILGESTPAFKEILDRRVDAKKNGRIDESNGLKIVINSTYGDLKYISKFNNKPSRLYNPFASRSVCYLGQIAITDLAQRLYDYGCQIIQVNTDGVFFTGEFYQEPKQQWEEEWNLELEQVDYDHMYQKDVSNYICWNDNNSKTKTCGGDINKYDIEIDLENGIFKQYRAMYSTNFAILDKCLKEYLVNGSNPMDVIKANQDNLFLFQKIVEVSKTKTGEWEIVDEDNNVYQNVNRIFATKDGVKLYKHNKDTDRMVQVDTAMNTCRVCNGDVKEIDLNGELDLDFYYNMAIKRIKSWIIKDIEETEKLNERIEQWQNT